MPYGYTRDQIAALLMGQGGQIPGLTSGQVQQAQQDPNAFLNSDYFAGGIGGGGFGAQFPGGGGDLGSFGGGFGGGVPGGGAGVGGGVPGGGAGVGGGVPGGGAGVGGGPSGSPPTGAGPQIDTFDARFGDLPPNVNFNEAFPNTVVDFTQGFPNATPPSNPLGMPPTMQEELDPEGMQSTHSQGAQPAQAPNTMQEDLEEISGLSPGAMSAYAQSGPMSGPLAGAFGPQGAGPVPGPDWAGWADYGYTGGPQGETYGDTASPGDFGFSSAADQTAWGEAYSDAIAAGMSDAEAAATADDAVGGDTSDDTSGDTSGDEE